MHTIELPWPPGVTQQHGFVHAGIVACALESDAHAIGADGRDKLVATMTATTMAIVGRAGVQG